MKTDFTCGFIGLGLIGGSIARALEFTYPVRSLPAMGWPPMKGQGSAACLI